MAGLRYPSHGRSRQTGRPIRPSAEGRSSGLILPRKTLSFSIPNRFIPAHNVPFDPAHPLERFCSSECREANRRWEVWRAGQTYRGTEHGKARRREQRVRARARAKEDRPPDAAVVPDSSFIPEATAGRHTAGRHAAGRISRLLSLRSGEHCERPEREPQCTVRDGTARRGHGNLDRARGGPSEGRNFRKILLFSSGLLCPVRRDHPFAAAVFLQCGLPQRVTSRAAA